MRRSSPCSTRWPPRRRAPFGVNFLLPFLDPDAVDLAASRARLVEFFYGDPDSDLVNRGHAAGALVAWQVGSVSEASAAAEAGCDVIVAQGTEAGGHVRGKLALFPLLEQVLGMVGVPVVAAGGISTGRTVAAALAAGADAVRVGTRFAAARESAAHPDYVEALLRAAGEDTVLTEAFGVDWPRRPASRSPLLPGSGRGGGRGHCSPCATRAAGKPR